MSQSQARVNKLLILVAFLAVVGGLAIVVVTSPQSWQLGPVAWFQNQGATTTPAPTDTATSTATPTQPTPTATPTNPPPTLRPSRTPSPTAPEPTITQTPPAPTATEIVLPPQAVALARVTLDGASNGRVRNAPNGDTVIAVLPEGTEVYVLVNQVQIDGVVWMEVQMLEGTTGWMADFLLEIIFERP